jgi:nucleoside-diphosphate-sugar epimerase
MDGGGEVMAPLVILVLGETGRYLSLVHTLLAAGHRVRVGTRRPGAATGVRQRGVEIVRVDLDDVGSIVEAATGADAVFAAGTFHRTGAEGDVLHGRNVIDAARIAEAPHLVYVSVAGADRPTDVPLFESKRRVEDYLERCSVHHRRPRVSHGERMEPVERTGAGARPLSEPGSA